MKKLLKLLIGPVALLGILPLLAAGQGKPLEVLHKAYADYTKQTFQEKLFIHLDRPLYVVGETIWMKAYCVESNSHKTLDVSKVAYLEILDREGNPVVQTKLSLSAGMGEGALIVPAAVASGVYTVRGYTNWMKNFGPEFFFETAITILNSFVVEDQSAVVAETAPAYDVQFFPEGGHLLSGFENRVAFRAVSKEGQGIDFQGALVNQQNDTLVRFRPLRFGIGRLVFRPVSGDTYRAILKDNKGNLSIHPLPASQEQGYLMQVKDSTAQLVKVSVAGRLPSGASPEVFLLTHTRLGALHAESRTLLNGQATFVLDKATLGEGITHLTVFDRTLRPVCERLYFRRPARPMVLEGALSQTEYTTREKVRLDLTASADAQLSIAVYLEDSLPHPEPPVIESYLWLTSDLKGIVESPNWYFRESGPQVEEALDNLMLTHGWSRFRWEDIGAALQPAHLPEYGGHFIYGRVYNSRTGQPSERINTFLATPDPAAKLFVAQSDSLGFIRYEVKKLFNTQEIILQTNTRRDSTYRIELASPFSDQTSSRRWPALPIGSLGPAQLLTRSINMQTQNAFFPPVLHQPVPMGVDSLAFFGKPSEKYFLDAFTRFPTMEEVMREYVPGVFVRKRQGKFHFMVLDRITTQGRTFDDDPLILLDGVPIFDTDKIMAFDPLKIKKLEVMDGLYYLGHMPFFGIVSYTTYKGDLAGFPLDPRALVLSYEFAQSKREFYAPRYDTAASRGSRLPDFRNLLYWSPALQSDAQGKVSPDFYTSDQTGIYRVVVQGLTPTGQLGSKQFVFEVKQGARQ